MAMRNIIKIDQAKCNGCGLCANACAEGAIKIINGKAKLISEIYCDGLGACIGTCPQNAITIEQRQAAEFDEAATKAHLAKEKEAMSAPAFVCPAMVARDLGKRSSAPDGIAGNISSQLGQWPVQLALVSPQAPYFADAVLLLVADCVPFAMGDFHNRFLKGRSIAVGCPKLDDKDFFIEKLTAILKANKLNGLTVIHMEVPCCRGLTCIAREAINRSGRQIDFDDVTVDLHGNVSAVETVADQRQGGVL